MTKRLLIACLLLTSLLLSCTSQVTPTATPAPTSAPTEAPTQAIAPTEPPTTAPTAVQETQASSDTPTAAPTAAPTESPTPAATATPAASPTPATAYMTFQDFQIVPGTLSIKAGAKVVFLIKAGFGSFHQPYSSLPNSTDVSGLFEAPPLLGDGSSYSFTFTQVGTYTVRCGYHPNEMVATIEVTP